MKKLDLTLHNGLTFVMSSAALASSSGSCSSNFDLRLVQAKVYIVITMSNLIVFPQIISHLNCNIAMNCGGNLLTWHSRGPTHMPLVFVRWSYMEVDHHIQIQINTKNIHFRAHPSALVLWLSRWRLMVGKDDQSPICGSESAKGELFCNGELFCKKNHHCTGYSAPAPETDFCVELFSKSALC